MTIKYFDTLPKPYKAYAKGFLGSMVKKTTRTLPNVEYVVPALKIDEANLAAYNEVCGFSQKGILPPTYLAVLSQLLQMNLMADEPFPFAMMGLVHIRNKIRQYRAIKSAEIISLSCTVANQVPHEKGQQFDFITTAKVNGNLVWEGVTTYLARGKSNANASKAESLPKGTYAAGDIDNVWTVRDDIGRRYARVSLDINPIHIHHITAKALGFPKAIAHGMWTKARCLAEMGSLPDSFEVDVQFKLPVLLPAKLSFKAQNKANATFELTDANSDKPHIAGVFAQL